MSEGIITHSSLHNIKKVAGRESKRELAGRSWVRGTRLIWLRKMRIEMHVHAYVQTITNRRGTIVTLARWKHLCTYLGNSYSSGWNKFNVGREVDTFLSNTWRNIHYLPCVLYMDNYNVMLCWLISHYLSYTCHIQHVHEWPNCIIDMYGHVHV